MFVNNCENKEIYCFQTLNIRVNLYFFLELFGEIKINPYLCKRKTETE